MFVFIIFSCNHEHRERSKSDLEEIDFRHWSIETYPVSSSVRAIYPVNDKELYFAGSKGIFGFTKDGGLSWTIDSIKHPSHESLEFRSIVKTNEALLLMCVASPALLFRSEDDGSNWQLVYEEDHPSAFYDSMDFWNDKEGIAMGDPTEGCLSIIKSEDGGLSWTKIDCDNLPATVEGEAAFAASNSNIALAGSSVFIVSGGKSSRLFHSPDKGESWSVFNTPIIQGGTMTGIFSCDFISEEKGIVYGGDWENKSVNQNNKAITKDGGKSWSLLNDSLSPGYRSCVEFLDDKGQVILATGSEGIDLSINEGISWLNISDEAFYTARISPSKNIVWLGGKNKLGKLIRKDI